MPQPIQYGGIVDRLRSTFRLTGRVPLQMDETVVPVAVAIDGNQVPYAVEPVHWCHSTQAPAVAGNLTGSAVGLPLGAGGTMVLDHIYQSSESGAVQLYNLTVDAWAALLVPATGGLTDFGPVPRVNGLNPDLLTANVGQGTAVHWAVGSILLATGIHLGTIQGHWSIPLGGDVTHIDGPFVLPPGGAVAVWSAAVNTAVRCTFRGRFFPSVVELKGD